MRNTEQIKNVLLTEGSVDYVGLWEAITHVEHGLKQTNPQKVREVTMDLIGELLLKGLMKAGDLNETGEFVAWQLNPEEALKRIRDEWNALSREPDLGDIAWFVTTAVRDPQVRAVCGVNNDDSP
jgi:hypothetical protein